MAVRNLEELQAKAKQIREEKFNAAQLRLDHIDSLKDSIRGNRQDIIDAIDTYRYCQRHGIKLSCMGTSKPEDIYFSCVKKREYSTEYYEEIEIRSYTMYDEKLQVYLSYIPETDIFSSSSSTTGGLGSWHEYSNHPYNDKEFTELLEKFASKVKPFCDKIFEEVENL